MKAIGKLFYLTGAGLTVKLILLGCAPIIGVPSSRPMIGSVKSEIGFGGGYLGAISDDDRYSYQSAMGHIYVRRTSKSQKFDYGTVVNGNQTTLGVGGFIRLNACEGKNSDSIVNCGLQVDLGLIYAGLSVPLAVEVLDDIWITSQPSVTTLADGWDFVGPSGFPAARLPFGVSIIDDDADFALDLNCGVLLGMSSWFCGANLGVGRR